LVLSWKRNQDESGDRNEEMIVADRIRMDYFPYEQVILACAKHGISGPVHFDARSTAGRKVAELEARQSVLFEANKMLTSMADFEMEQQPNSQCEWTAHHESCSTCFRLVASGWFLMWRRMRNVDKVPDGGGIEIPEIEMYSIAVKWLSFCTMGKVAVDRDRAIKVGETLIGGITQSDKSLLVGIATGLSLSTSTEHRAQASNLHSIINGLF
jgi:hypothetical protein